MDKIYELVAFIKATRAKHLSEAKTHKDTMADYWRHMGNAEALSDLEEYIDENFMLGHDEEN
ncbi:hypothetical protein LAG90_15800 [Marinilongibacter aquaticus]|uniref:hypothetical protein n=1 Tax=Marinilongibacter aquaticus TaxID=2975157 RepID=UPI0021BD8FCC|nr:hypothetical protein [Marinilongibacter aquaticus]UBM58268.1 hypothetical protein LAG90_15800 [Marinilongibacter aquaticus]